MPVGELNRKVAFVTGGSSGIGLGIVRAFVDAGMSVAFGYRTPEHLDRASTYLTEAADRVHAIEVDVVDRGAMEAAAAEVVQRFGKVHVLVNNAGVQLDKSLSETTYEDWDWVMGVNLGGVFNGLRAFLPAIREHGEGGHVVTTASILGLLAVNGLGCYTTSKFALVGMMESLRGELADTNIGVSVFCPGAVDTELDVSDRSRPGRPASATRERGLRGFMEPREAGERVLRGMANNDFYILSHPEFERTLRARSDALVAALVPQDVSDKRNDAARYTYEHAIYKTLLVR